MRAVVVCRFPIYREALARLVSTAVEAEALGLERLEEALAEAALGPVDLVLIDAEAGDPCPAELRAAAEALRPAPIVLFGCSGPAEAQEAAEAGVRGCIPKTAAPELAVAAVRLILAGGLYFSDLSGVPTREPGPPTLRARLSGRQLEVLRLIEMGQTNKEIAKALGISVATVKLHVQAILNITGARNRTEAALRARNQFK